MRSTPEIDVRTGLEKLAGYPYQILTWVDDAGYPVSVAVDARVAVADGAARFTAPAGLTVPLDREVSLTGSHIRPQPGYGYDERRHVTVWGTATTDDAAPFAGEAIALIVTFHFFVAFVVNVNAKGVLVFARPGSHGARGSYIRK
jgi:hypothetical protein